MTETLLNPVELVGEPVSQSAPTGKWIRYEPEFENLKAEVDRLAIDPGNVDWKKIVELSSDILANQSKDLLVASYLVVALFHLDGYEGLSIGLEAIEKLTSTYWDSLFPEAKKKTARGSALRWLAEKVAAGIEPERAKATDGPSTEQCIGRLERFGAFLDEKLGSDAPALGLLTRRLKEVQRHLEPASKVEETQKAPATEAKKPESAAKPDEPSLDISTPEAAERSLIPALKTLDTIGRKLRSKNPADPRAYRLTRVAAWLPMVKIPSHSNLRVSFPLNGFSPELPQRFEELASQGNWTGLLDAAEAQFERSVLWLDPQRVVCEALEGLGEAYSEARRAVVHEVAWLVQRFPELPELRFANDVPFASERTKAWVSSAVSGKPDASVARMAVSAAAAGPDEELDEALSEAGGLLQKQQLAQALSLLGRVVDRGSSARMTFMRRMAMARFLVGAKQHRLAIAQLQYLDEQVQRFGLEEWDPALSLDVLRMLLVCHNRMMQGAWKSIPEAGRQAQEILSRLARLDAGVALEMQ